MDDLLTVKKLYNKSRDCERQKLITFLKENSFEILNQKGGRGKKNYTAANTISSYDLSNWKWIEAKKNGTTYFISFQAFDRDPKSKNLHVLFDRIGVYAYEKYSSEDAENKMINTGIDLPLDEIKCKNLLEMIDKMEVK